MPFVPFLLVLRGLMEVNIVLAPPTIFLPESSPISKQSGLSGLKAFLPIFGCSFRYSRIKGTDWPIPPSFSTKDNADTDIVSRCHLRSFKLLNSGFLLFCKLFFRFELPFLWFWW